MCRSRAIEKKALASGISVSLAGTLIALGYSHVKICKPFLLCGQTIFSSNLFLSLQRLFSLNLILFVPRTVLVSSAVCEDCD